MPLAPEHRAKLLLETRNAAAALLEDLCHVRELLKRGEPSRAELRTLSNILRRLLVERDIMTVAAPRIGRFHFLAPDNYPIIKSAEKRPIVFFQSGGRIVFGIFMRAMTFWEAGHGPNSSETEFNPEATVRVRLDEFLSQPVLCFRGQWLSRRAVVKYAANVASGVHSNTPTTDVDRALARMRHAITFRRSDQGRIELIVNTDAMRQVDANTDRPFAYDPNAIDVVLIELLAAAHFVECSDDTARLEAAIRAELHLPAPQP